MSDRHQLRGVAPYYCTLSLGTRLEGILLMCVVVTRLSSYGVSGLSSYGIGDIGGSCLAMDYWWRFP